MSIVEAVKDQPGKNPLDHSDCSHQSYLGIRNHDEKMTFSKTALQCDISTLNTAESRILYSSFWLRQLPLPKYRNLVRAVFGTFSKGLPLLNVREDKNLNSRLITECHNQVGVTYRP